MARSKLTPQERKEKKRLSERNRIESRLNRLGNAGITDSITYKGKSYTPKQLARQSKDTFDKAIRSHKQKERVKEAQRYAKAIGATPEEAKKVRSFKEIAPERVYRSDEYMSIVWANHVDKFDFRAIIAKAKEMTIPELKREIRNLYKHAKNTTETGSGDMHGFFLFDRSTDPGELKQKFDDDCKRGYTYSLQAQGRTFRRKLVNTTDADLTHIAMGNEFTERGILNMMYAVMSNVKNTDKVEFYEDINTFLYKNVPELYEKIFEE